VIKIATYPFIIVFLSGMRVLVYPEYASLFPHSSFTIIHDTQYNVKLIKAAQVPIRSFISE